MTSYVANNTNPSSLYDFLLQQMAAESYFETADTYSTPNATKETLTRGTNRVGYKNPPLPFNEGYPGLTRMTDSQAEEFVRKFQIIHQWSDNPAISADPLLSGKRPAGLNDAGYLELDGQQILANTGLSATLIRVKAPNGDLTNEYTLAIRSTEFRPFADGGDYQRDKSGADTAILAVGFALAQLNALEYYYQWLLVNNKLPINANLNVTGYSLGGHLATVFTEIHQGEMNDGQTVTFNGAGRGSFNAGVGSLSQMLADYRQLLLNVNAEGGRPGQSDPAGGALYDDALNAQTAHTPVDPLSIYADPRHLWAEHVIQHKYSTAFSFLADENRVGDSTMGGITQVWGKEIPHNANMTANSGIHGPALGVFIESQPLTEGWPAPLFGNSDFGNGHAIVLLADSLALMRVMQQLVPSATIKELTADLFPRSTNVTSNTDIIGGPLSGDYEYDALENVLDGLQRIILGSKATTTPYRTGGSGFSDTENRQKFHEGLNALMTALGTTPIDPSSGITPGQASSLIGAIKFDIKPDASAARTDIGQFLSLYYQAPFTLKVSGSAAEAALIAAQNSNGSTVGSDWAHDKALSADDRAAGKAVFTDQFLADRADMLSFKLKYNERNLDYQHVLENSFVDMETGNVPTYRLRFTDESNASIAMRTEVIDLSGSGNEANDRQIFFGSDSNQTGDSFSGGALDDHLYGMGGDDTLNGQGGKDYIEGGYGDDHLHGDGGNDTLLGGGGNDSLYGEADQDSLDGGLGADALSGDAGNDVLRGGDGSDTLLGGADNDRLFGDANVDQLNGGSGDDWLEGGAGDDVYAFVDGDGDDIIRDSDGQGRITINGQALPVGIGYTGDNDWISADGTIRFQFAADSTGESKGTLTISYNGGKITVQDFEKGSMGITLHDTAAPAAPDVSGTALSDIIQSSNPINAADGNDFIIAEGAITVDAGDGNDYISLQTGSKRAYGGAGNDLIFSHILYLPGNVPSNVSASEQAYTNWWRQEYADWGWSYQTSNGISQIGVTGDSSTASNKVVVLTPTVRSDNFDAWATYTYVNRDAQWIDAGGGNDLAAGDEGNDTILGGQGEDTLLGGAGNDQIRGGADADDIFGMSGDDYVVGDAGDDTVSGGYGADQVFGGLGNDILAGDDVSGGQDFSRHGDDLLDGGGGNDYMLGQAGNDTLLGSSGNDSLYGGGNSVPAAYGGNDWLDGGEGDDLLVAGDGDDFLFGGIGNDNIDGDMQGASLPGNDYIDAGEGNDTVVGNAGADTIYGGTGDDFLSGDAEDADLALHGDDQIYAGDGNDWVEGQGGADRIWADEGNDTVYGDDGADLVFGGAGIDWIDGGEGNDSIYGGSGDDGILGTTERLGPNSGALKGGAGDDMIDGGAGSDALAGDIGNDTLLGGTDADQLDGGEGDDVLDGGSGDDLMVGGKGNDTYVYSGGADGIVDAGGVDTLVLNGMSLEGLNIQQDGTQLKIVTGQGVGIAIENGFTGAIDQFDFGYGPVVVGNFLSDNGTGTPQAAPMAFAAASFQALDAPVGEMATTTSNAPAPANLDLRHFLRLGTNSFNLVGTAGSDNLYGSGVNDTISGLNGDDYLYGAAGNDLIDTGNDNNYAEGEEGNDSLYGGSQSDTLRGGADNDVLDGGDGIDQLFGDNGNDLLIGGFAEDSLTGGAGNDTLSGGYGNDVYLFESGFGVDVINDPVHGAGAMDIIRFGSSIDKNTVELVRDGMNLVFSFTNGDKLTANYYFYSLGSAGAVDCCFDIQFADGSRWGIDDVLQRAVIKATSGADVLYGTPFGDRIDGLAGNDYIVGYAGNDTLSGGNGMDTIAAGSGDDVLEGGQDGQVDNLYGESGNDTYLIKPGAKVYINYQQAADFETGYNIIRFASGINPSGLQLYREDQTSTLTFGYTSPQGVVTYVYAQNFFRAGEPPISEIRFDDFPTMVWTYQDIIQRYMTPTNGDDKISLYETSDQFDALAGNDTIYAMGGDDVVYAGAGRDSVDASFGNDTLAGGLDSDVLKGYEGSDTYLFNLGDGHDWLYEERSYWGWVNPDVPSRAGEIDRIKFGAGITQSDIGFSRDGSNLIIRVKSDNDAITVANYFYIGTGDSVNIDYRIEEIEFSNGAVWKKSDIESRLPATQADTLTGTTADNTFTVDDSRDVVIENANAGTDIINSSVSLIIPNNVENVVLIGAGDLAVTANGMSNRITGNSGNNNFLGLWSDDTVAGGAGDDVYDEGNYWNITENPNEGYDTQIIHSSEYITLSDNVEKLITRAIGNINGNASDNFFDLSGATGYYSGYDGSWFPVLDGKAGADYFLIGRDLIDKRLTFVVDNAADKITFLKGSGIVYVNSSINYTLSEELTNLRLLSNASAISATGNSRNNIIRGNQYDNQMSGLDGNDTLLGYGGKDTLIGGAGDDVYYIGDSGSVALTGEAQDSWAASLSDMGSIVEDASGGYDIVRYGTSGYSFYPYNLTVPYNVEKFIFTSNSKTQFTINGNDQSNIIEFNTWTGSLATVLGLGGDDKLTATYVRALLDGGDGNDTLIGGDAPDTLIGGSGNNEFHVNNAKSVYNLELYNTKYDTGDVVDARGNNGAGGSIVIFDTTASTGVFFDRVGNDLVDTITGVTILDYFANNGFGVGVVNRIQFKDGVIWTPSDVLAHLPPGTSGNDLITGTAAADLIEGKGGDDTLNGLEGNDTLDGGSGADSLRGGAGDDIYKIDHSNDQVIELTGDGNDEVQASVNFILPDNVEILRLSSTGSGMTGKGNALSNAIYGTDYADTLDGLAGADSLYGGYGDDIYICDAADTIQDAGGFDTLLSDADITSPFDPSSSFFIEKLVLTGNNATKATGSIGNDVLDGSQNANANTLIGGKGDDEYIVGANDVIVELAGEGLDILGVSVDTTLQASSNLEGLRAYGSTGLRLTGTSVANVLYGNTGNDTLDGLAGADSMYGGAGSDTYYVDNTGDAISDSSTDYEGIDTVISSVTYTLAGSLENLTLTGSNAINGTGNAWDNVLRGNGGVNVLKGGNGNDIYYVSTGDSVVENLNEGWDSVYSDVAFTMGANIESLYLSGSTNINGTGNALRNYIYGNAGDNTLDGKAGDDLLVGGAGNDTYIQDSEGDYAWEEEARDEVDPLTGEIRSVWIDTGGIDTVKASASVGGVDEEDGTLWGLRKHVENLELTGTTAQLGYGNEIANSILGNSAANVLRGFEGNDTLNGAAGADTMFGGVGNDTYVVDSSSDVVTEYAGEGSDTIQSTATYSLASLAEIENLTLLGSGTINGTGNAKDNILIGNSSNNTLTGGAGNDRLDGGAGNDTMVGGTGNDTYVVDAATDVITENANEGIDTIEANATYSMASQANVENLTLMGSSAINATGNGLANVLTGNNGNNVLDGGAGIDTLIGGAGNDSYVVDSLSDVVTENANEGTDLISAGISYSLATLANVENLTLTGSNAIDATGNAGNNALTGNSGNNVLDGGAGNDTLVGGAGNDTYIVDSLSDVVTEASSAGTDTIQANLTYTIASLTNVENLTLTGTGAINATGNTLANKLTGNSGNNRLDGGSGNDTMMGGAGNDTYVFNVATDVATENANEGIDTIEIGVTLSIASVANVENITLTGTSAINATGNTLDNVLMGNSANNTLTGGAGNDRLDGGAGNDTMVGGTGNDTYVVNVSTDVVTENAGEGTDTVESSITYTIASLANLENITLTGSTAINATGNASANALIGNSGVNVLTGGAGNDTLDGAAGNDSLVGGTGNDTYVLGRGYGAETVTENDTTAGNTDVASFMAGISNDQIWFRKVNTNDLEVSVIGTSDKLTLTSWYLGNQYHVEQFKTADGKLLLDSDVQKLVDAMAAFAPPAAGQTTLPSNYQSSLNPVLAANWH